MDVLKDKSYKQYDSLSRYTGFPTYYNTLDEKYMYGIMSQMNDDTVYVAHEVVQFDTLESLAFKYYGRPDYYWVIAWFNKINDSFTPLWGNYKTLKIPTISNISFR